jgi:ParB-like chromosome segregation protein Spo0J
MSEKISLAWRSDPDAETVLGEIACLAWTIDSVTIDQIDWSESANNCARLSDPLNKEKIEDYASSMKRGDVFPRIVVECGPNGFIILGGNQRSAAAKQIGSDRLECYIVKPLTTMERELVIRSLNSRHGWGSTKEERIEHAVYLVRKFGVDMSTAARSMVVSETTIFDRIRIDDTRVKLAKAGVETSKISNTAMASIARVADLSAQKRIAQIANETKATVDDVANVVGGVVAASGVAATSKLISTFAKTMEQKKHISNKSTRGLKKPRREKFLKLLSSLSEFLEVGNDGSAFSSLDELSCSFENDYDTVRTLYAKINSRLQCIFEVSK